MQIAFHLGPTQRPLHVAPRLFLNSRPLSLQFHRSYRWIPSQKSVRHFRVIAEAVKVEDTTARIEAPRGPQWQVHKFGGTCMATADRIKQGAQLLETGSGNILAVVSAMGSHVSSPVKVTDIILRMLQKAEDGDASFHDDLKALKQKHVSAARELIEGDKLEEFLTVLAKDIEDLEAMLKAISVAGTVTEDFSDFVVGHGELWSARLLTLTLQSMGNDAQFMDARDVLVVNPSPDGTWVDVDYEQCNAHLDAWTTKHGKHNIIVITGFIARNRHGRAATLRRNGSDFSATIFAALYKASHITIWTDVDGIFSADPRKVPEAFCLDEMTYNEAWELSYFGANVLHPRTTLPAIKHSIPITLRNFFNTDACGTEIKAISKSANAVKGFTTIDDVSLVSVEVYCRYPDIEMIVDFDDHCFRLLYWK